MREARRQKGLENCPVPKICVLDPDGDIVKYLQRQGEARLNTCWSCYHTQMFEFTLNDQLTGIIGCAVGAPFAVLVAEQMFVSGCELLISITSAGIIDPSAKQTRFLLIREALRDEGTSHHYLPPGETAILAPDLFSRLQPILEKPQPDIIAGSSWTTDAPYRETVKAIDLARKQGAVAVEMEAAALYAFAKARQKQVICYAHLTNTMAQEGKDFEKGWEHGSLDSLKLIEETIACVL